MAPVAKKPAERRKYIKLGVIRVHCLQLITQKQRDGAAFHKKDSSNPKHTQKQKIFYVQRYHIEAIIQQLMLDAS